MNSGNKTTSPYSITRDPLPDLTDEEVNQLKDLITKIVGPFAKYTVQRYGKNENELLVYIGESWKYYSQKDLIDLKKCLANKY